MGVSTDGILFYGFFETEQDEWTEGEDQEEREEYLEEHGEYRHDALFSEKFEDSPLYLGYHCSGEYPLRYLAIKPTNMEAARGYPKQFDPSTMIVQPEWEQQLRDCAKELGFDLGTQQPGWWLASYWS